MKHLVLLRHAKAEPIGELGDHLRAVSAPGRQQARALGPMIRTHCGEVDTVLVSSALRTKETYRLLAAADEPWPDGRSLDAIYDAGPRELIALLGQEISEDTATVMVVGHEPTMSSLAHMLHDSRDELGAQIRLGIHTATACILQVPVAWDALDRNTCHLTAVVRPTVA
ncbi:MAG: histidine phosphatase family protein [Bowdeniella nasicola]|nr:histidine phosphatase family protein [Bowdeniella nasicola]